MQLIPPAHCTRDYAYSNAECYTYDRNSIRVREYPDPLHGPTLAGAASRNTHCQSPSDTQVFLDIFDLYLRTLAGWL